VVHHHVVADDRRLADDDAHPVIDEAPPSDHRAGVDLDPRREPGELGDEAREKWDVQLPERVGDAVGPDRPDALVENDLKGVDAVERGVLAVKRSSGCRASPDL
jgi:hypothetical protein